MVENTYYSAFILDNKNTALRTQSLFANEIYKETKIQSLLNELKSIISIKHFLDIG